MPASPAERRLYAAAGAYLSWANTADRAKRTQPARDARREKYRRQIDPDGVLAPDDLERRVDALIRADMAMLAAKSVKARRTQVAKNTKKAAENS